jgi:hypothetical protein
MKKWLLPLMALSALGSASAVSAAEDKGGLLPEHYELYGYVELEGTLFPQEPDHPNQKHNGASIAIKPTFLAEWLDGDLAFTLTPFARLDAVDDKRTHVDLREAKLDFKQGDWSFTAGADFVFWGKTEAGHLVDIINSADAVESLDLEDKLGQPLVRVARFTDYGEFSAYWLPYFRRPTFTGEEGRLRPSLPVDPGAARYKVGGEEWAQSAALRWTHTNGDFDVGTSAFYGISRDAALEPFRFASGGRRTALRPVFDDILQVGFDGQYTTGPTLWKLETIARFNQLDRNVQNTNYVAATGGLEYTFFGIADTNADLGVVLEGAYDSRTQDALTPFEEDAIYGLRLALNDTEDTSALLLGTTDVVSGGTSFRLEAERRIGDGWKLEVEGQAFLNPQSSDIESGLKSDSFVRLKLSYFW